MLCAIVDADRETEESQGNVRKPPIGWFTSMTLNPLIWLDNIYWDILIVLNNFSKSLAIDWRHSYTFLKIRFCETTIRRDTYQHKVIINWLYAKLWRHSSPEELNIFYLSTLTTLNNMASSLLKLRKFIVEDFFLRRSRSKPHRNQNM